MSVVKVYCKIETSPWALTLTETVPEAFELPTSDWPEKIFSEEEQLGDSDVFLHDVVFLIKKNFFWPMRSGQFKRFWNCFGKSKCPRARLDLIVNFHHGHFIDPNNCPWVSEDGVFQEGEGRGGEQRSSDK